MLIYFKNKNDKTQKDLYYCIMIEKAMSACR